MNTENRGLALFGKKQVVCTMSALLEFVSGCGRSTVTIQIPFPHKSSPKNSDCDLFRKCQPANLPVNSDAFNVCYSKSSLRFHSQNSSCSTTESTLPFTSPYVILWRIPNSKLHVLSAAICKDNTSYFQKVFTPEFILRFFDIDQRVFNDHDLFNFRQNQRELHHGRVSTGCLNYENECQRVASNGSNAISESLNRQVDLDEGMLKLHNFCFWSDLNFTAVEIISLKCLSITERTSIASENYSFLDFKESNDDENFIQMKVALHINVSTPVYMDYFFPNFELYYLKQIKPLLIHCRLCMQELCKIQSPNVFALPSSLFNLSETLVCDECCPLYFEKNDIVLYFDSVHIDHHHIELLFKNVNDNAIIICSSDLHLVAQCSSCRAFLGWIETDQDDRFFDSMAVNIIPNFQDATKICMYKCSLYIKKALSAESILKEENNVFWRHMEDSLLNAQIGQISKQRNLRRFIICPTIAKLRKNVSECSVSCNLGDDNVCSNAEQLCFYLDHVETNSTPFNNNNFDCLEMRIAIPDMCLIYITSCSLNELRDLRNLSNRKLLKERQVMSSFRIAKVLYRRIFDTDEVTKKVISKTYKSMNVPYCIYVKLLKNLEYFRQVYRPQIKINDFLISCLPLLLYDC